MMSDILLNSYNSIIGSIASDEGFKFFPSNYLQLGRGDGCEKVFGTLSCKGKSFCRVYVYCNNFMRSVIVEATDDMIPSIVYGGDFIDVSYREGYRSFVKPIISCGRV